MEKIVNIFNNYFRRWNITLPENNIKERLSGFISESGWLIQYCFGKEDDKEYLDFYSSHRMTDDDHIRIYENGEKKDLPTFKIGYLVDCLDQEPIRSQRLIEHGKEAVEEHNKKVTDLLIQKGFNKFTINMTLNAGILDE